jgi:hypothetical protein
MSASPPAVAVLHCQEDVMAVLEVMVRKQGRRTNPVVVGDSVSMAEAVAGELLRRLERGEVPEELAVQRGGLVGDLSWVLDEDPANSATASSYSPGGDAGKCGDPGAVR